MHNSLFINFITASVVTSAAFLAHGKDINNDTTYSSNPNIKLNVKNNATLTLAFQSNSTLSKDVEVSQGSTIHFKNDSTDSSITYSFGSTVPVYIFGNAIVGDDSNEYSTTVNFSGANASFDMQDLTIYGGSKLITGTNTAISGHLRSLKNATSLTPQEAHISFDLNTAGLDSLTIESTINLNNFTLSMASSPLSLGIAPEFISADGSYTLFTNIKSLYVDNKQSSPTTYDATAFFTSDYFTADSQLVYTSDGSLILTGLSTIVPEPTTSSLTLLSILALSMRRRRK